jgi:hypothetical protein
MAMIPQLMRLRGIGPETATILAREVFYRDFANRKAVASYAGLTPSPYMSGTLQCDQGISKAGNRSVRTAMIELAWLWLRHQPDSALSQCFGDRVGSTEGRLRRIAVVAPARKLLVALWRYVSRLFRKACRMLRLRHLRTRPYTPRTNGKAERFIQTLLREWAYALPCRSSQRRSPHFEIRPLKSRSPDWKRRGIRPR